MSAPSSVNLCDVCTSPGACCKNFMLTDSFWADDGVVYAVVSTDADRGRLTQVAQAIYDQMEKTGG